MLRLSPEVLYLNELNLNTTSVTIQLTDKLLALFSPHKTRLQTLRLGAGLTPRAYSVAYELSPESPLNLHHNVIPDFQGFSRLEHLHISLVFAGQLGFRRIWDSIQTDKERKERLQEFDGLLPQNLTRITFDIGDEFTMRHCPLFPQDHPEQPNCTLNCPYSPDVEAFLPKLAERAQTLKSQGKCKLWVIHVNYCIRPFALPMPLKELPSGFNWKWIYAWEYFSPWKRLSKVKNAVEQHGILFTYEGLEPYCGRPRTHLPKPVLFFEQNETEQATRDRVMREYHLSLFDYEDEMCSEHVWTRVFSNKKKPEKKPEKKPVKK